MSNKENLPITPLKAPGSPLVEYSPSHPKRALKPVSPNKNNGLVGKLSFLQSDHIDEHFDYIHGSQEEMKQQLYLLEVQTKQTNVDLEQLFDRLKNNNQNLNKLLSSIAEYSKEVTTEGNATKSDANKIIDLLHGDSKTLDAILAIVEAKGEEAAVSDTIDGLKNIQSQIQLSSDSQVQKLGEVQKELSRLDDLLQRATEKFNTVIKPDESQLEALASLLKTVRLSEQKTTASLENFASVVQGSRLPEILLLKDLVEQQTHAIEALRAHLKAENEIKTVEKREQSNLQDEHDALQAKIEAMKIEYEELRNNHGVMQRNVDHLQVKTDTLHDKHTSLQDTHTGLQELYDSLQSKYDELSRKQGSLQQMHTGLQEKYGSLRRSYEAKYNEYVHLETQFVTLADNAEKLDFKVSDRYGKIQQMHSSRMAALGDVKEPAKKRVFSMPVHETIRENEGSISEEEF